MELDIFDNALTFSPNWYLLQPVLILQERLFIASNSSIIIINIQQKKCVQILQLKHHIISQIPKVTSIGFNKQYLIAGCSQGYLIFINLFDLKINKVHKLALLDIIYIGNEKQHLIITDNSKVVSITMQNDQINKLNLILECQGIKRILSLQFHLLFISKSILYFINKSSSKVQKKIKLHKNKKCLEADVLNNLLVMLVKENKIYKIIFCFFSLNKQFNLECKSNFQQITQQIYQCQLKLTQKQKSKQLLKACMSVFILQKDKILLTGKQGQFYIINLPAIKNKKFLKLQLQKQNLVQEQSTYQILLDNRHYKQIYKIYKYQHDKFITVGIDRIISFWNIQNSEIIFKWQINFLGAKTTHLFKNSNKIIIICNDKTIKQWEPLNPIPHALYIQEHWQSLQNMIFQKFLMFSQYNIIIIIEQHKLICYSLQQSCENLQFVAKLHACNLKYLLTEEQLQKYRKPEQFEKYVKRIGKFFHQQDSVILYCVSKQNQYFISLKNRYLLKRIKKTKASITKVVSFNQFLAQLYRNMEQKQLNVNFYSKQYNLSFNIPYPKLTLTYFELVLIKNKIVVCTSYDLTLEIHQIDLQSTEIQKIYSKKIYNKIIRLKISPQLILLIISQKNQILHILDLAQIFMNYNKQNTNQNQRIQWNIRGHSGFVIDALSLNRQYVVTSSNDLSVRLWNLEKIRISEIIKPKKKNKEKKKEKRNKKRKKLLENNKVQINEQNKEQKKVQNQTLTINQNQNVNIQQIIPQGQQYNKNVKSIKPQ